MPQGAPFEHCNLVTGIDGHNQRCAKAPSPVSTISQRGLSHVPSVAIRAIHRTRLATSRHSCIGSRQISQANPMVNKTKNGTTIAPIDIHDHRVK